MSDIIASGEQLNLEISSLVARKLTAKEIVFRYQPTIQKYLDAFVPMKTIHEHLMKKIDQSVTYAGFNQAWKRLVVTKTKKRSPSRSRSDVVTTMPSRPEPEAAPKPVVETTPTHQDDEDLDAVINGLSSNASQDIRKALRSGAVAT